MVEARGGKVLWMGRADQILIGDPLYQPYKDHPAIRPPKITQEDMVGRLARQGVRINQSQYAKMESGDRPILDHELAAIAKALKVPVQVLFE